MLAEFPSRRVGHVNPEPVDKLAKPASRSFGNELSVDYTAFQRRLQVIALCASTNGCMKVAVPLVAVTYLEWLWLRGAGFVFWPDYAGKLSTIFPPRKIRAKNA